MGNRFREKPVEEGLDGDVAREALKEAVVRGSSTGAKRGNRRRVHVEEESAKKKVEKEEQPDVKEEQPKQPEVQEEETSNGAYAHDEVEEAVTTLPNSRGGRAARGVAKVLGGDILADKFVLRQIPLLLLCLVFLLLLVANRYQVESLSRKKKVVMERVNELREQQIQLQRENQNSIRISQIRDDLEREKGLAILPTPPNVI